MKQLNTLLFALLCLFAGNAIGQEEPAITQFWSTYASTNPATTGLFYKHAANAHYRNQWVGVNGAPNTLNLNYGMRLDAIRSGVGITYRHDAIGFNRQNRFLANYAYHLKLGETFLSFGVAGGIDFFRVKYPDFVTPSTPNDPSIPVGDIKFDPQFTSNLGIAFHSKVFNAGISCTQFNQSVYRSDPYIYYRTTPHFWLFMEYYDDITDNISIQPRIQVVTDVYQITYMASLMVVLYKNWWGGVNYSLDNYVGGMIGYDFQGKYRIGYSYDYTKNKLSSVSQGTHEIVLSYLLK